MKITFVASFSVAIAMLVSTTSNGQQQQRQRQPSAGQTATQPVDEAATQQPAVIRKVGFRMANWRTIHGDGTQATTELVSTLQKIGCEVKQENHGGHADISYRCASWKAIPVKTDDQSNQWHQWLVNNEFETVILNPPATTQLPTIRVRMADWKTNHAQSAEQAQALKETYELIGCEVVIDSHGDHIDLKFRCPNWSTVALVNGDTAHTWQQWLNGSGFETEHEHSADGYDAHAGHEHAADSHAGHDHAEHGHEGHEGHEGHNH